MKCLLFLLAVSFWPIPAFSQLVLGTSYGTASSSGILSGSNSSTLNNPATSFTLMYTTTGSPTGFSIQIEGSKDAGNTYNPCGSASAITQANQISCAGFYDHVQVNLTNLSGGVNPTVIWTLQLLKNDMNMASVGGAPLASGQKAMAASMPVTMASDQPAIPVSISGTLPVSGTVGISGTVPVSGTVSVSSPPILDVCQTNTIAKSTADVSVSASSTAQLVALSSGQTIYPCAFFVTQNLAGTIQFVTGTGTNCGTGQATVTPAFGTIANSPLSFSPSMTALSVPISQALCLTTTGLTAPAQVHLVYVRM
jgi:hypothetical protein